MTRYAIGVGSNRGDRAAHLRRAAELVAADGRVAITAVAPAIETPAAGGPPGQGPFLNTAWVVATWLGPHQLLHRLQAVETALGRARSVRWGPRTIDLDLLLADEPLLIDDPVLVLPHPRLAERGFVLRPLAAIAPAWRHPRLGATIAELAAQAPP